MAYKVSYRISMKLHTKFEINLPIGTPNLGPKKFGQTRLFQYTIHSLSGGNIDRSLIYIYIVHVHVLTSSESTICKIPEKSLIITKRPLNLQYWTQPQTVTSSPTLFKLNSPHKCVLWVKLTLSGSKSDKIQFF